jgi:hypothetical protein
LTQSYQDIIEPVIGSLADRIEELATEELAAAGYKVHSTENLLEVTEPGFA